MLVRAEIPAAAFSAAEAAVGVVLIAAGVSVLVSLIRRDVRLRPHAHDRLEHTHLATADDVALGHRHTPVLVGILHGFAGSGPALAMIAAAGHSPALALAYLTVFSGGVFVAMGVFGALFGRGSEFLLERRARVYDGGRFLVGTAAVVIGIVWLLPG